jgi:adenosylmethionine-8-amino-7-oxononanoate aminotransferase
MPNADWVNLAETGGPPITVEGSGIRVTDLEGRSWIDVNGGFMSVNVGHGRSEIADAVHEQMLKLSFAPPGTVSEATIRVADKLAEITPGSLSRSFLVSGGSEANETALKIARGYHVRRGEPGRHKVVSRRGSYHGATGGVRWLGSTTTALSESDGPLVKGLLYAPSPNPYRCELGGETPSECAVLCAEAVEQLILYNDPATVSAVIAEPIASRECVVPGDEYWPMLRETCDRYGVVLIADEVITGFGRTGKMFALEHWGVVPDIMTVAKGIVSSYLPFGAAIATAEIADVFGGKDNYLRHVFTASGHPVSSAAALKNIEILEDEGLVANAATVGAYFKEQLQGLMTDHPVIGDVRGSGLLLGLELVSDRKTKENFDPELGVPASLSAKVQKQGLWYRAGEGTMNFGPPLCITKAEVNEIVHAVDLAFWELEGELKIPSAV